MRGVSDIYKRVVSLQSEGKRLQKRELRAERVCEGLILNSEHPSNQGQEKQTASRKARRRHLEAWQRDAVLVHPQATERRVHLQRLAQDGSPLVAKGMAAYVQRRESISRAQSKLRRGISAMVP
jgi:hypothetical protein